MRALLAILLFASTASAEPLFMSQQLHDGYLKYWPKSDDPFLNSLKDKVHFYTEREMPLAFQFFGGVVDRVFAAKPDGKPAHANTDFPWKEAAGLHGVKNAEGVKFVYLPGPITFYRTQGDNRIQVTNGQGPGMRFEPIIVWEYPNGTVFGEILTLHRPGKRDFTTFEVRTRERVGKEDWRPRVYRPFPTREELDAALARNGVSAETMTPVKWTVRDPHPVKAFKRTTSTYTLPAMPEDLVKKLLAEEFHLVTERFDGNVIAPTSEADFGIVPKGYTGSLVRVSKASCSSCHADTLKNARDFDVNREWYGRIRGSDNIFSFHIFAREAISHNGSTIPVKFRKELVDRGLLVEKGAKAQPKQKRPPILEERRSQVPRQRSKSC